MRKQLLVHSLGLFCTHVRKYASCSVVEQSFLVHVTQLFSYNILVRCTISLDSREPEKVKLGDLV